MTPDPTLSTGAALVADACRRFDGLVLSAEPDDHEQRLGVRHFLGWWFAHCDPALFVDLRAFTPNKKDPPWTERVQLAHLDAATATLLRWNRTRCVYFSVCPRKSDDAAARKRDGVACVPGYWVDVDADSPDIVSRLRGFVKPPDHIVHSGHGYHGYWRFDAPVPATPELKDRLKILARVLGGDPAVAEVARVFRVPCSWNRKREPYIQSRIVP